MKKISKSLALLLVMVLSIGLLAGCGGGDEEQPEKVEQPPVEEKEEVPEEPQQEEEPEAPAEAAHEGEWTFTDSLGRTATFHGPLTRVAPSGKMAQQCIFAVNPDVIIGLSTDLSPAEGKYYPEGFQELPVFGSFYGKKANFNRESVLAAEPQVIIDLGQVKKNMEEDLNALQDQLGVPVVFLEASLADMSSAFRQLGELLDKPEEAEALALYCAETVADAQEKAASIPEEQKKTLYYGMMDSGLTTAAVGDFHTEVIDMVGALNVVPADLGRSFIDVDMERVLAWDPDVVIFAPNSVYASVESDPVWQELRAIQEGSYYEVPMGPYNWLDQPPAANRIIGVKWLGNLLYPEVFDYDMVQETMEFYELFYHTAITEDDAKTLMANSTFRAE